MTTIPVTKFLSGIPVYMSPRATYQLFLCEWCQEQTPEIGIYSTCVESMVLCNKCATRYEPILAEFLAQERTREWLEHELAESRHANVVNFSQERRKRAKETGL